MQSKSMFTSRTFWFNSLGMIAAPWIAYAQGALPLEAAITASVGAAVNIGLRWITKTPVHVFPK